MVELIEGEVTEEEVKKISNEKLLSCFTEAITTIQSSKDHEWIGTELQRKMRRNYEHDAAIFSEEILRRMG